ncbi:DegT/DnrJ/EryC1/StrS family aminotransferase [Paenibacillus solisilvae]|uniref:DegT/DnrJ/EryC1/StrS family aminotransferase n=1 Tax=Paenibacillus solisilvae TaxID=2486751 RepID=A0ABW0VQX6_9BACL
MEQLALYGGQPVIGTDRSLPNLFPRDIAPKAYDFVKEVLDSGFHPIRGMAERFEHKFAKMNNARYALSVSNCTSAIHTALAALEVGSGDEIVVTSISDYGSLAGVLALNAVPVFSDIDPDTGNVNAELIAKCITSKTKAIIVVHWHGSICDMDPIVSLAKDNGIPVIEDCCQCPFGEYKGKKAGTMGDIGCFSFDAEKHLSTEHGGMVLTNNKELYDKAFKFAISRGAYEVPGYGRKYDVIGLNYRYGDLEAAVGMAQLDTIEQQNARRVASADRLMDKIATIDGVIPISIAPGSSCLFWIFPVIFQMERFNTDIRTIGEALSTEGITGCSHLPYYFFVDACDYLEQSCERERYPGALKYISRTVRWVWNDKYTEEDVDLMYKAIKKVADYFRASE